MNIKHCTWLCLLISPLAQAQNLVPNPSFELYNACPNDLKKGQQFLQNWLQPTDGTFDYFNRCSSTCGVPLNPMGHQDPKSGDAYIGLTLYNDKIRSYVQVELKEPLLEYVNYTVEFSVCLSEKSKYAIGNIGGYFTVHKLVSKTENVFETYEYNKPNGDLGLSIGLCRPQFKNSTSNFLSDYKYWTTITGTFKARGGEKFMTIGNFATTEGTPALEANVLPVTKQGKKEYAYYFLDDVAVYQSGSKPEAFTRVVILPEVGIARNEPVKTNAAKMESVQEEPVAVIQLAVNQEVDVETMLASSEKKETKPASPNQQPAVSPEETEAAIEASFKKGPAKQEAVKKEPEVKAEASSAEATEAAVEATLNIKEKDPVFETAAVESAVETALQRKTVKESVIKKVESQVAAKPTILKYLFFEKNSARILPESEDELLMLSDILSANPLMKIEISGHTDESGTEDGNLNLSQLRAQAVVNFMQMLDVDPTRLTSKGWGSQKPIADNNTEEGRIKNRRVEFTVLGK